MPILDYLGSLFGGEGAPRKKKRADTNLPDEQKGKPYPDKRGLLGVKGYVGGDTFDPRWTEHQDRVMEQENKDAERAWHRKKLYEKGNLKPTKRTG